MEISYVNHKKNCLYLAPALELEVVLSFTALYKADLVPNCNAWTMSNSDNGDWFSIPHSAAKTESEFVKPLALKQ